MYSRNVDGNLYLTAKKGKKNLCIDVNDQVPSYMSGLIPSTIREATNYPLRNRSNLTAPSCRF